MPKSKHRKNRKPYRIQAGNGVTIRRDAQINTIKVSGIHLEVLLKTHVKSKGQGLLKNGAPTKYWIEEEDLLRGKPRSLTNILRRLNILNVDERKKVLPETFVKARKLTRKLLEARVKPVPKPDKAYKSK